MSKYRPEVLRIFKKLHATRKQVFQGDEYALTEARKRINDEFRKNKHVENENSLAQLVKEAQEAEEYLRHNVVQAKVRDDGVLEVKITQDVLIDNATLDKVPPPDFRCKQKR